MMNNWNRKISNRERNFRIAIRIIPIAPPPPPEPELELLLLERLTELVARDDVERVGADRKTGNTEERFTLLFVELERFTFDVARDEREGESVLWIGDNPELLNQIVVCDPPV